MFVCYNCYKEGHTAKECTNPKQPWRQILFGGKDLRKEACDRKNAATNIKEVHNKGKAAEFVQGSSKDAAADSAEVINLWKQLNILQLQSAQVLSMANQSAPDFQ